MRLPFTSKIVAHSRYLPGFQLESLTDSTWTELTLLNHTMSNVLLNHIASLEDKYLGKAHPPSKDAILLLKVRIFTHIQACVPHPSYLALMRCYQNQKELSMSKR